MNTFAAMKAAPRWLLSDPNKVPYYANGSRRHGKLDTPADLACLATYEEANAALAKCGPGWRLGFALGPDGEGGCWQGVDIDAMEDKGLTGLADALPGYVEISPSGDGVHAIGYGRHFPTLGSNGSGIEAYSAARYFTVTENLVRDGGLTCLANHIEKHLASHHRSLSAKASLVGSPATAYAGAVIQVSPQTVKELRSALNHLRSDGYDLWINIGHALKSLGETGRGLWLDWSGASSKFDLQEAADKWESFASTQTGYKAVFAKAQAAGWVNPASNAAKPDNVETAATIAATPFVMPAFFEIPPRQWLLGHWLLRGTLTTVIAPGGIGKSAFMITAALSLASGRDLLGKPVWGGSKRAWLWNLEDDGDELDRQFAACCLHHGLSSKDYADRIFTDNAASVLCTATKGRDGFIIHEPIIAALVAEIRAQKIDVLVVDPFVSSHRAEENDNGQIDAIAKSWAGVAREANCSIVLVHHSRKLGGQQVDAEAARGASALGNAARSVLVLNRMEKSEANRLGIADEERRKYFRVNNDKANRAPAEKADWYRFASVLLGNGGPAGGDSVGVIERWSPPEMSVIFDDSMRKKIQAAIASGEWRLSSTAEKNWVGNAIAEVIDADIDDPAGKKRVTALLKDMMVRGQLRSVQGRDANRHLRPFIVVGDPVEEICDSPMW